MKYYALRFPPRGGRWTGTYATLGRPCIVRTFATEALRDAYVEAAPLIGSVTYDGERRAVSATTTLSEDGRTIPISEAVPGV